MIAPDPSLRQPGIDKSMAFTLHEERRKEARNKIDRLIKIQSRGIKGQAIGTVIMVLLMACIYWASQTKLEQVAMASGAVIPAGNIKVVQHLEGGILEEIMVSEGDTVAAGQELFRVKLGIDSIDLGRLKVELDSLLISRQRTISESENKTEVAFTKYHNATYPDIVRAQHQLFLSNRAVLARQLEIGAARLAQARSEKKQVEGRISNLETQIEREGRLLRIFRRQQKGGSSSEVDVLNAEIKLGEAQSALEDSRHRLNVLDDAIEEIVTTQKQEQEKFRIRALLDLDEIEEKVAIIRARIDRAGDQQKRSTVLSPIDGVVKALRYTTVGNVIRPAEVLAEIVPGGSNLLIEARLQPVDIGFVKVGAPAMIKVGTYDFSRYGGINGKVSLIGASSVTDEQGNTYFEIHVEPEKEYLGVHEGDLPISPGMQAVVDVKTGTRTVLEFLLKPILKIRDEAFRER